MTKTKWAALGLVLIMGFVFRISVIDQPIRYDEALSYLSYIQKGPEYLLSHYDEPNNHVGHSLLAYFSSYFFPFQEWAIRLPALIFGLANIFMVFLLGKRIHSYVAGMIAAVLVACSPDFILYSTNARGYQMVAFFVLVITYVLIDDEGNLKNPKKTEAYIFCQAYGMFTIPTMLYPSLGFAIYLFLKGLKREDRKQALFRFIWVHVAISVIVMLLFTPIIMNYGMGVISHNHDAATLSWTMFNGKLKVHMLELFHFWASDFNYIILCLLFFFSSVALILPGAKLKERRLLFVSVLLAALMITFGMRVIPFFRTWEYVYLLILLYAAVGVATVLNAIHGRILQIAIGMGGCGLFAISVWGSLFLVPVPERNDTGPFLAAPEVVRYLRNHFEGGVGVLTHFLAETPLRFYAEKQGYQLNHDLTQKDLLVIVPEDHEETLESILLCYGLGIKPDSTPLLINEVPHVSLYLIHPEDFGTPSLRLFPLLEKGESAAKVISPWYGGFGTYYFPWIEHEAHGWQKCLNEDPDKLILYDQGLGRNVLIEPAKYPVMKILLNEANESILVKWEVGTKTPHRRFMNLKTGEWMMEGKEIKRLK